jgi:hypothetical protein
MGSRYFIVNNDVKCKTKLISQGTIVKEYSGHSYGVSGFNQIAIQICVHKKEWVISESNFYTINVCCLEEFTIKKKKKNYKYLYFFKKK